MSNKITMADVIDRLFTRLSATYGAAWTRQWADVPIVDVKTAWGHELAGYIDHMQAIGYALDNLPERCPNVIQFKHLCRAAPQRDVPRIEAPKADPARVAEVLSKLALPPTTGHDPKAWARRIVARHEQGDNIRPYSLKLAQSALKLNLLGAA